MSPPSRHRRPSISTFLPVRPWESFTMSRLEVKTAVSRKTLEAAQAAFALDNVKLEFTDEAIGEIADEAVRQKTGARGLRSIVEKMLQDIMYELPSIKDREQKKLVISKDIVQNKTHLDVGSLLTA